MHEKGTTLHKAFGIAGSTYKDFRRTADATDKAEMKENCQLLFLLVIDEISMVTEKQLEQINKRLQDDRREMPNYKQPFGGVNVIITGDFTQLRAVG